MSARLYGVGPPGHRSYLLAICWLQSMVPAQVQTIHCSMKLSLLSIIALALCLAPASAQPPSPVSYAPAVVSLTGTITKERYPDDAPENDKGYSVWVLRLDRPISLPASNELDVREDRVTEVQLSLDAKQTVAKRDLGRTHFTATGTLFHGFNAHHLRSVVLQATTLKVYR